VLKSIGISTTWRSCWWGDPPAWCGTGGLVYEEFGYSWREQSFSFVVLWMHWHI